jgi:anti-anti-sigma factor
MLTESHRNDRWSLIEDVALGADGHLRLILSGVIEADGAHRLHQSMIDVLRRRPACAIAVDIAGVTALDPAGIEALLRCQADARLVDCRLFLTGPAPETYRLLQTAGLLAQFGVAKPRPDRCRPGATGAALGLVNCGLGG